MNYHDLGLGYAYAGCRQICVLRDHRLRCERRVSCEVLSSCGRFELTGPDPAVRPLVSVLCSRRFSFIVSLVRLGYNSEKREALVPSAEKEC